VVQQRGARTEGFGSPNFRDGYEKGLKWRLLRLGLQTKGPALQGLLSSGGRI
jgi:hypothetical protein